MPAPQRTSTWSKGASHWVLLPRPRPALPAPRDSAGPCCLLARPCCPSPSPSPGPSSVGSLHTLAALLGAGAGVQVSYQQQPRQGGRYWCGASGHLALAWMEVGGQLGAAARRLLFCMTKANTLRTPGPYGAWGAGAAG